MVKAKSIFFFFNQLADTKIYTGGETRGRYILEYFKVDPNFKVKVICPKLAASNFEDIDVLKTGQLIPEEKLPLQNLFWVFVCYLVRSIETLRYISQLKNNYLYSNGDFFCNAFPAFIIRILYPKTRWIVIIHHININPFARKSNSFFRNTISFLLQQFSFLLIKLQANLVFTDNQDVKKYLLSIGIKQPIEAVGNALNVKQVLSEIDSIGKAKVTNQICYFGRLSPTKGVLDLPEILANILSVYPDYKLNIVGQGADSFKDELKAKFKKYSCLNSVIFHGYLSYPEAYKIILTSKVCLFPSYEEGWGISLFETIICQTPVVAYDLPVFHEIFGDNLITVKIGDTASFSRRVIQIINNDDINKVKKSIRNCYNISLKYDWKNVYQVEKFHILSIKK